MKCLYCNAELNENSTKCEYCGNEQKQEVVNNNTKVVHNKIQIIIFLLLIVSIVMSMVACFFPYFDIYGYSQNYVSYDGQAADGVFIIIFGMLSLLFILLKKRIPVLIFQILSLSVFLYDYIYQQTHSVYKYASRYYGMGFKMLFVFTILSVILSLIRVIWKKKLM